MEKTITRTYMFFADDDRFQTLSLECKIKGTSYFDVIKKYVQKKYPHVAVPNASEVTRLYSKRRGIYLFIFRSGHIHFEFKCSLCTLQVETW